MNLSAAYIKTSAEATHHAGVPGQERVVNNHFEVLGLRGDLFMKGSWMRKAALQAGALCRGGTDTLTLGTDRSFVPVKR